MTELPLGNALVISTLLWSAARIAVAHLDVRTRERRCGGDELLHHIDSIKTSVDDVRIAVEQLADPHGGAR